MISTKQKTANGPVMPFSLDEINNMKQKEITQLKESTLLDLSTLEPDLSEKQIDRVVNRVCESTNPYFAKYKGYTIRYKYDSTDVSLTDRFSQAMII